MVTTSKNRSQTKSRRTPVSKTPTVTQTQSANHNGSSSSNTDALRKLYAGLLKSRLVQEHVMQRPGYYSSAGFELSLGHEAVAVGTSADLLPQDTVVASPGNLAALVARGIPFDDLLANQASRLCRIASLTPASLSEDPFNLGTGIALAHKLEKRQHVVLAFCPERLPTLERWREALRAAALQKLPIVYIIENTTAGGSSSPQDTRLQGFSFYIKGHRFPNIMVDARDVVAVWRVAQESIHRARNGSGPTLIDCRMESAEDPLTRMEHYLRKRSLWDDGWKQQLEGQIQAEISAAAATYPIQASQ